MKLIVIAKMDNSASVTTSQSSSKQNKNKDTVDDVITINEKVNLTKPQHQVLKIICDVYQSSFSEYIQEALVEAMKFDIEEGNFSDALLEKIGGDDSKKDNNSPPSSASIDPGLTNSDLDLIKKLQAQIS
jgi:hypothetical protein